MFQFQDLFQWDRFITPSIIKSFYRLVIVLIVLSGLSGHRVRLNENLSRYDLINLGLNLATIAQLVAWGALALYLLWPVDLLADPFLGLGQLDDLAVLLVAVELFIALAPTPLRDELAGSPTSKVMRDPWWPLPVEGRAVDVSEGQTHLLSTDPPVQ